MPAAPLPEIARVDAYDKVRGATRYAADHRHEGTLHAMLVPARIAKGRLTGLDLGAARAVPGVVRILTKGDFSPPPAPAEDGPPPPPPTFVDAIAYRGQPIALVVAESLEAAIESAELVQASFEEEPFAAKIDSEGSNKEETEERGAGNGIRALAGAATTIDQRYVSPTQHHNPIEMIATSARLADGKLRIEESSQWSSGVRGAVAGSLSMDPADIEVDSSYIGGGFGQKGTPYGYSAIVARAAILLRRPVELVVPRSQIFHQATFRPESHHHVRLGADARGKMTAAVYHAEHEQSRTGQFPPSDYHEATSRLYDIPNYTGTAANIRIDRQSPGYMRCPHPHPSCFAFESAVDELAIELGRDPVAFRLDNDGTTDVLTGNPFSSKFLRQCLIEGAERFGWSRRTPEPGSMRAASGARIGWGVAVGAYPSMMVPSIGKLRVFADGRTTYAVSGHEMGQGIRTSIANVLIQGLGIDPTKLEISVGDTATAPQHITAGSWGSAGAVPTTARAVERMRAAVAELLGDRRPRGNIHRQLAAVRRPYLEVEASELAPGQQPDALDALRQGGYAVAGPEYPEFTTMSYIAHFVEVEVEPRLHRVRMPRVVSIADCGRVISPRTARSQIIGGVVWAFGSALREATEVDSRYAGYLNCDLADYVVPVNADIGDIDVGFVNEPDPKANAMGLKGLGEVVMAGASAAIANAVHHATGRRLRHMPIRIEDMI